MPRASTAVVLGLAGLGAVSLLRRRGSTRAELVELSFDPDDVLTLEPPAAGAARLLALGREALEAARPA